MSTQVLLNANSVCLLSYLGCQFPGADLVYLADDARTRYKQLLVAAVLERHLAHQFKLFFGEASVPLEVIDVTALLHKGHDSPCGAPSRWNVVLQLTE